MVRLISQLFLFAILAGAINLSSWAQVRPDSLKKLQGDTAFTNGVRSILIAIQNSELPSLRTNPRDYLRATLDDANQSYPNIGIKLKGGTGSFRGIDDKPSFTINFDKFNEGQTYHGLDKIHLNNSVQDYTYMCEILGAELFTAAGYPAPRATHAHVKLNDRNLGMYVLKEGFDKPFLRRHYKHPNGNLYDGGFHSDIDIPLEKDSGKGPDDHSDLKQLVDALAEADLSTRMSRLQEVLDVDKFITFMALEVMIGHWDGYCTHHNNYRIYRNPESDKFEFLPHGMDQLFYITNSPVIPHMEGMLAKAVLEIPKARQAYLHRFVELFDKIYKVESLTNRIEELRLTIEPALTQVAPREIQRFKEKVFELKQKVVHRGPFLEKEVGSLRKTETIK